MQTNKIRQQLLRIFLGLLFLTLLIICRYQPALSPASNFTAVWVTKPNFVANYLKTGQLIFEYQPCAYELLGWENNSLFYQSDCQGSIQFWQYAVGQTKHAVEVTAVPPKLTQNILPHNEALELVRADGVRPVDKESVTREVLLRGDGLVSPDGVWTAVIAQHLYAPQDILLIAAK